jgi:hypothetical protein
MDEHMHFMVRTNDDLHEFSVCILYLVLDSNFKIHDTLTVNFQIQTFAHDGLILWIGDSLPESSFTIEIQNRQVSFHKSLLIDKNQFFLCSFLI